MHRQCRFGWETVLADILSVDTHLLLGPEKDHVDSPRTERFSAIRWHPRDPSVFLVSTNDHRLILVRLDRGAFAPMWKRGMPLGKTLSELEAFEGQDVLRTNCDVIAFAFSPDGSAFAFVTSDNILTVRQTSKPHWTIMGGQLTQNGGPISRLEFLSTPQGIIKGFLISKRYGTRVEAVQLSEISDVVIAINLQAPEPQDDGEKALPCFGHVVWQKQYSTILLSNSLRGSIFAFHVNFCESSSNEDEMIPLKPMPSMTGVEGNHRLAAHQEDDSSYIERVAATRQQSSKMQRSRSNSWVASRTMFVDHISEVASPDPIISFVLDEGMRPAPGPSSSDCSIFNLHPKGIHQLYLPKAVIHHQRPSTDTHDPLAPTVPPARSLSLAGEILVDVQVEQEVAQAEELELSDEKNSSRPIGAAAPSSVPPSQNGKQNPTRTPAAAAAPPHKHSRSSTDNFLPSSDTLVTHQPIPPAISPSSLEIILREVEKTREGVAFEFHNLFVKAIEKQDQRLRNQFIAQSEIETRRHEHLMNVVSSNSGSNSAMSNAKNVAKLVEQAVRNELRYSPGFSGLSKGFEQSVLELVKRGVQEGFKKQLGQEVEGVMKKPQVMELIRNLVSQGVGQETAEKLERVVRTTLIPMLVESATSQQASMNGVVQEVRQLAHELHEVRAGAGNAEEIRELKATVAGLREQVADLHETLKLALAASSLHPSSTLAAPAPAPAPPGGLSTSWRGTSADRSTQPSQPGPNSSRTATPPSAYEDMFLEALSDRAPGLLSKLIDDGPHDRLESVFLRASANNNNNQSSSRLSQPVLLTLAHKLSEQLAIPASSAADDRPGSAEDRFASSLGARGANRLRWIWRCVDAVDEQDRQTAQYLARVLDLSYSHLHARKLALIQAGGIKEEIEGINQVLWIIEDKLAKFRAVASAADR
ncbi:hypothetical protein VP01_272g5 [Puccinia sorghi]|uniref:Enhancer of mRNA-decapping protein 4 WD40 repeat region domain-containing protein n=1 Tax=Puccinia sorghi TaxID=27349 RepID=A0A0L6V3B1_9BASI|nr:hypothetical protein VP01_272g5 [Puccinia sorghi]